MRAIAGSDASTRHAACSGCSLCLLVCPVWRRSRDLALTPHGRAKALQNGVAVDDLADSADSCTLCGACRPVCPEEIDPVDLLIRLRRQLAPTKGWSALLTLHEPSWTATACGLAVTGVEAVTASEAWQSSLSIDHPVTRFMVPCAVLAGPKQAAHNDPDSAPQVYSKQVLLPGAGLRAQPRRLAKVMALLGTDLQVGADDGSDISLALEAGALLPQQRLERFLAPLRASKTIIAADGLLCHYLARWLPKAAILSLGQALSSHSGVRSQLRPTDLYVIEPRAYHADYPRLVKYYDRLRKERGCDLNLDLQRIAIPATARSLSQNLGRIAPDDAAQIGWLLQGRKMNRIVVESLEDHAALARASQCDVIFLADLVEEENHAHG